MATAGNRYEERTGNIWSYSHRGDQTGLKAAIARGVDVNILNTVGWTPAHAASAGGKNNTLRILIKAGADLTIADRGGNLPVHHAAKNGHMHTLKVLQDFGGDVTKVRLSQVKGKAARDFVIAAYRKNDIEHDGEEEEEEENLAVGYERKQSKSTAFWGPRRTPISCKIKKNILKNKRKTRKCEKEKKQRANANKEQVDKEVTQLVDDKSVEELNYVETVRQVKRLKKLKRMQKQGRQKEAERKGDDENLIQNGIISSIRSIEINNTDEDESQNDGHLTNIGFAALSLFDDSDSE